MEDIKKAKTHKGRKILESKEPQVIEEPKESLFINTINSSEILRMLMNDLHLMRKEQSKKLLKKNTLECVFSDAKHVENFSRLNSANFFCYTSDMKKKPMNLVLGSIFNHKILDVLEFEVTNYIPIEYFSKNIHIDSYMKPVILFQGDLFETDFTFERIKKFFLDYFRLYDVDEVNVSELRRVVVISVGDDKEIKLRSYQVSEFNQYNFFNSLNLEEIGPSVNMKLRKIKLANESLYKNACKQPRQLLDKKEKNIETNMLGEKRGRLHMTKQNLNTMALRKYKKILGKNRKITQKKKEVKEANKEE